MHSTQSMSYQRKNQVQHPSNNPKLQAIPNTSEHHDNKGKNKSKKKPKYNVNEFNKNIHQSIKKNKLWNSNIQEFYEKNDGDEFFTSDCTGNKKALFIGINYYGTKAELNGCISDVKNISELMCSRFGFKNCLYLTDEQPDRERKPTYKNIINGMKWLVRGAKAGDSLFFHFSGHGGTFKDVDNDEHDGFDETILPLDYTISGQIVDDVIYSIMVEPLPQGCKLTAIFDSCHSGTVMDLPYTYQCDGTVEVIENDIRREIFKNATGLMNNKSSSSIEDIAASLNGVFDGSLATASNTSLQRRQELINKRKHDADVIQFSGCRDDQTSADLKINNVCTGAMSYALITVLKKYEDITYADLLKKVREIMKQKKFPQIPQLSTSHPMNMNEKFIM